MQCCDGLSRTEVTEPHTESRGPFARLPVPIRTPSSAAVAPSLPSPISSLSITATARRHSSRAQPPRQPSALSVDPVLSSSSLPSLSSPLLRVPTISCILCTLCTHCLLCISSSSPSPPFVDGVLRLIGGSRHEGQPTVRGAPHLPLPTSPTSPHLRQRSCTASTASATLHTH